MTTPEQARKIAAALDYVDVACVLDHSRVCTAADALRDLARQVEELQADAERYRWFREAGEAQNSISRLQEAELDAAIDAARNAK